MSKLRIIILFGGCSEEHDVSIKSAQEIAKHIDTEKYEPIYIGITRSGIWLNCEKPCIEWEKGNCNPVVISTDKKTHGLILFQEGKFQTIYVDVVFPVLHGKMGEDGAIQGLLEVSGIPYIGCDIQSSVICMDKSLTYITLRNAGIATPDFLILDCNDTSIKDTLTYPVFVKPARSGSSFGITKVNKNTELDHAIESARKFDSKVIIEQAVLGSEVGCAVLGNSSYLTVGEVDHITLTCGFFRIHQESKPESGSENSVITVPANLPLGKRKQIQELAKSIYKTLGCKGLARIDMFLKDNGDFVINEVNTMPGFTSYSRYPRMMAATGIMLPEIIDRLIMSAMEG